MPDQASNGNIVEKSLVYKTVGEFDLRLIMYEDQNRPVSDSPRPAIVFFFGGGWSNSRPDQFEPQARYLASRGMAAFTAEYRVKSLHDAEPLDGVFDAADAIRWVRSHADELRIDPARIAAAGGSSGGHLAASTGVLQHTGVFGAAAGVSRPDALVLFNPALDTEVSGLRLMNGKEKMLSCTRHVKEGLPPTLIFHGTEDASVSPEQPRTFCRLMREHGNRCELIWFEGEAHGFFNLGRGNSVPYLQTLKLMEVFLSTLGFVKLD